MPNRQQKQASSVRSLPVLSCTACVGRPLHGAGPARVHRTAVADAEAEASDALRLWAVATLAGMLSLDNILAVLACESPCCSWHRLLITQRTGPAVGVSSAASGLAVCRSADCWQPLVVVS